MLVCRGTLFLLRSGLFLSPYPSWHAPNGSNSTCLFWVVNHPSRTPPRKSLSRNLKNRSFPSPHHQTLPSKSLTPSLTMLYIGWVQAGGAWALCVPSFHMCPKLACCPFICRGLEARHLCSLTSLWAAFRFSSPFRSWTLFDDGPYISLTYFLISLISCHIILLFLL